MNTIHLSLLALLVACGDKETPEPSQEPSGEPSEEIIDADGDGISADEA